jgi:hypothetical protein
MLGAPGLAFETWDTSISIVQNYPVRDPKKQIPGQGQAAGGAEISLGRSAG